MPTLQQTVDEATKVLAQTKAQGSKPFKGSSFDTPIPYSTLTSKDTPAEVVTPPPSTQASGLGAGIETMANQNKDAYTQNLAQNAETARAGADTSWEEYMKSVLGTEGKTSLTDKAYRSTVDPAQAELNDINNQIIAEQVALRRRVEKAQKENPLGKSAEAIQEQVDQINRESISKQADLAVIQLSKQGKYDSAKAIADRAVSAQFEKQQVKNEALKLNYERNKDLFTTAEQRAFETAQADRERNLEFEMYKKKADYDKLISNNGGGAPTVKTINGVDMQWNPQSGQWETITSQASADMADKTVNQLDFILSTADTANQLAGKSGAGTIEQLFTGAIGGSKFKQLEAYTNTLKTNMLTLATDPSIKKFFGPQMSNADVLLMTSAGTTLNPQNQSPAQLREEIARIKDFTIRAKQAVDKGKSLETATGTGLVKPITAPDGIQVIITD